jgi:homospermidine synthase
LSARAARHRFDGRLVMVGFGSIGQGVLPLLLRHVEMSPRQVLIVMPGDDGHRIAREFGLVMFDGALTPANYREVLGPRLGAGDFLLNLSVDVSTAAMIALCHEVGALYLDTVIEPWAGFYADGQLLPSARTNHALREAALALRRPGARQPTAVLTHGANPGLVSHFVKRALLDVARDSGVPADREGWARLAQRLGVRTIHVAERDTQVGSRP